MAPRIEIRRGVAGFLKFCVAPSKDFPIPVGSFLGEAGYVGGGRDGSVWLFKVWRWGFGCGGLLAWGDERLVGRGRIEVEVVRVEGFAERMLVGLG